mgnify:CR=1 FL=1
MIRKDIRKFKYGTRTEIRVVEGYRDQFGKVKQKTIKTFGYLEDQENQEAFMKMIEEFNDNYKKSKRVKIEKPTNILFHEDTSSIEYNYGYRFLEAIYEKLDLGSFFTSINFKGQYSLNEIFKFLTFQRILNPDSKRATFQNIQSFYKYFDDYSLDDVYRSLDIFDKYKIELQKYINDKIKEIIGRDTSYAYYDVTNYYNEIDFPKDENDLRQRGVSKEHRVDPIIQLGLFIDSNGLPISMSLFKGNTSDTKTLQPVMKEIKANYNLNRLIVVADKGLNSTSNINYIVNNNDGYVVSQILKGKKGNRYHEQLFEESNYTYNQNGTFKYKLFEEDYEIINLEGEKETRKRKVLIYWKLEDAILEAKKRDDKLARALKSLGNNAYAIKHTYEQYIKELHTVDETGEIADKVERVLDNDKVSEDAKYDGYFCIITSELDYDYKKILEVYGNLWKIEESFRITKSDLEVRPIYVNTTEHINGHFMICYTALVIIRLLQLKLKNKLSTERIVKALNSCRCTIPEKGIIHLVRGTITKSYKQVIDKHGKLVSTTKLIDNDETVTDLLNIIESFNSYAYFSYSSQNDFNKYIESIKY